MSLTSAKHEDFYTDYLIRLGEFAAKARSERAVFLRDMDKEAFTEHVLGQRRG